MSDNSNAKKAAQLGMPQGTAVHKLRKMIMFSLIALQGLDNCFKCKQKITNIEELSVEHKVPWLDSEDPKALFFDLNNIAFSHLACNISAARSSRKRFFTEEEAAEGHLEASRQWKKKFRVYDPAERKERYKRLGT